MNPQAHILDKKLLSKYQQDVVDRRQFRNQMRAELKAMAKQSFLEEFELLKANLGSKLSSSDMDDRGGTGRLDGGLSYFHDSINNSPHGSPRGTSTSLAWSSPVAKNQRLRVPETPSSPPRDEAGSHSSGLFVLSTAPIQTSDSAIHKQISASMATDTSLSLLEQANRFAEMNALFSQPNPFDERDLWFRHQLEVQSSQIEAERIKQREAAKEQKKKLDSSMEMHRDRLEKARHPPRRFPMDSKPSSALTSPRAKAYRTTTASMEPSTPMASSPVPSASSMPGTAFPFPASPTSRHAPPSSPSHPTPAATLTGGHTGGAGENHSAEVPTANQLHFAAALDGGDSALSRSRSGGGMGFGTPSSSPGSPKSPPPGATAGSAISSPPNSPRRETGMVTTLREDDFLKRAESLEDTIKKLVRSVVHQELVRDCQQHHYTQRMQNRIVEKHENLLVKKMEASLADKLKAVQEDIDKLKTVKLLKLQQDEEQWMATQDVSAVLGPEASTAHVQSVTQEMKNVIQQALRMHFSKLRPDAYGGGGGMGDFDDTPHAVNSGRSQTRVHGSINTRASFVGGGMGGEGFGRDHVQPPPLLASVVEEVIVKPKSKAERLLGMATDVKSGMPINEPPAASTKFGAGAGAGGAGGGSGMWGGLGSLFSSKPGSSSNLTGAGGADFGKSAKPMAGGMSTRSDASPSLGISRMHSLEPIADEEASDERKASHQSPPKQVPLKPLDGDAAATSSTKSVQGNASTQQSALAAELAAEETVYRDLMANLVTLAEVKNNVKKELKDWELDFQRKHGREPTAEDKSVINDRFLAHKMVSAQVQEAKDLVKASEDKLKEIRARMG